MSASKRLWVAIGGVAGLFVGASSASAQSGDPAPAGAAQEPSPLLQDAPKPWRLELSAWMWLTAMNGTTGVRGTEIDVDATFGDIVDGSDSIFAISGRLEFGYERWGGFVDAMYSDLGFEAESGPLGIADVDINFKQMIVDFGVMYRIGDWEPGGQGAMSQRRLTLDLYAGGRYTDIDGEYRFANAPDISGSESWLDPIVGAKVVAPISEHWYLLVNGDIGGFGVESDFTWSATGLVGYDFRMFDVQSSFLFGYRAIGWDYESGSGTDRVVWDVIQHGLLLGLTLRF